MEFAARQFARRVMLGHLALLCLVLLTVGGAAKFVYQGARQQVIQQAEHTQTLLTKQTATGIDNYYDSITSVLNLLQPSDSDPAPATQPTDRPDDRAARSLAGPPSGRRGDGPRGDSPRNEGQRNEGQRNEGPRRERLAPEQQHNRRRALESGPLAGAFNRLSSAVWENIKTKCTMMFILDPVDEMRVVRVIGKADGAPEADLIVQQASTWLADVHGKRAISPFFSDIAGGANLVCVPMRGPNQLLMVAVVPLADLERNLLAAVNRSATTGAMLVDEQGIFVSASMPGARGKRVADLTDPVLREMALSKLNTPNPRGDTRTFEDPRMLGDVELLPSMSSIEPITVLGDKTWFLVINSNLDDVDRVVKPIFHDAMTWAIVVMIAVMAILTSTAVQMIRSRLRLKRAQMDLINKELVQARQIQLNWLPQQPCTMGGVNICAINTPATQISGDFYNWFELPDGRIAIIIGDVTGHGMSAAFLMATTQLLVRTTLPRYCDPGFCLEEVNRQLCTQIFSGQFVTMLIMILDLDNSEIAIASGGHPPPLICEHGRVRSLDIDPALVLGVDDGVEYPTQKFPLDPGAMMLLYTDGVPDVVAPTGSRFTLDGLLASLQRTSPSPKEMLSGVIESINTFRLGRDLSDDLTLVALQFAATPTRTPNPTPAATA